MTIQHSDIVVKRTFDAVVTAFEAELGAWGVAEATPLLARHASWSEVETAIEGAQGSHGLMVLAKINQGVFTSLSGKVKHCILYIVGNPVIANGILDVTPAGAFYVPFRVCLYEDQVGTHISFDRPASFLAELNRAELAGVGTMLDGKIDAVVQAVQQKV